MDWKKEIAVMVYVKQLLAEVDVKHLWPHHLPAVAASGEDLRRVERHLGFKLDAQYAAFLLHANGWRGFYQTVDLFGTNDLLGNDLMSYAVGMLGVIEPLVLNSSGCERGELIPIATTREDLDLFVLTKPSARNPGTVIWFAGTEIQRFSGFDDFFLGMVDYNRRQLAKHREKLGPLH
jgi:hypothetical protein